VLASIFCIPELFLGGDMLVADAQREVRTVFVGGFWGQLVSSVLWLTSAVLATWANPRTAIITLVVSGIFIFPLTQLMLRLSGRRASLQSGNPLNALGMQVAFILPISMLLLIPIAEFSLHLFYPALMILLGAHYFPFIFMYGMRMFGALAAILIGGGVVIAMYFPAPFSLGAWVTGASLFLFAWLGRVVAQAEARRTA
jgi:hypothetical protein